MRLVGVVTGMITGQDRAAAAPSAKPEDGAEQP